MQLKLMSTDDCQAILEFETRNKTYFEQYVPPRPKAYFNFQSLHKIIKGLIKEQNANQCFLYLAYQDNKLIGRANLVNINKTTAELGYRLCQSVTGQGLATQIIASLLKIAKATHQLTHIKAHTTTNNIASIRILEKNGFKHIKIEKDAATLNSKSLNFTYFTLDI